MHSFIDRTRNVTKENSQQFGFCGYTIVILMYNKLYNNIGHGLYGLHIAMGEDVYSKKLCFGKTII